MLNNLFLGLSMVGAEWVLYLLVLLSIVSVSIMFERARFYSTASRGLPAFRERVRQSAKAGRWDDAKLAALERSKAARLPDLESEMALALLAAPASRQSPDVLSELAQDAVVRARLQWDRNLSTLATIGNNAPFVGLFGTVLGIIKAFHDLSKASAGMQMVSSGISEALIATAVGILVAIPAVAAYNLFQRRVKSGMAEAEALKSFLVGHLASSAEGSR